MTSAIAYPVALVSSAPLIVFCSFTFCAVADVVICVASIFYAKDPLRRRQVREEWQANVQLMKPIERPTHAGSLLWLGFRVWITRHPSRRKIGVYTDGASLLRDCDVTVLIGRDKLPATYDEGNDELTVSTTDMNSDAAIWLRSHDLGDEAVVILELVRRR